MILLLTIIPDIKKSVKGFCPGFLTRFSLVLAILVVMVSQ